jgi:hypothetical protein
MRAQRRTDLLHTLHQATRLGISLVSWQHLQLTLSPFGFSPASTVESTVHKQSRPASICLNYLQHDKEHNAWLRFTLSFLHACALGGHKRNVLGGEKARNCRSPHPITRNGHTEIADRTSELQIYVDRLIARVPSQQQSQTEFKSD